MMSLKKAWLAFLAPAVALACTTTQIPVGNSHWVFKSYDWHNGHGTAIVNPRKLAKTALFLDDETKPKTWTSKYGSLTFNQHGRELPLSGINEAGLVVEIMWLNDSDYPKLEGKKAVNEVQWIQYQLDRYELVKDAVANKMDPMVAPLAAKVHYLMCDRTGQCATFEYLHGQVITRTLEDLPLSTLTNNTYDDSVRHWNANKNAESLPFPGETDSLSRFVNAAWLSLHFPEGAEPLAYGFKVLDTVRQRDSQWNLAYDRQNRRVHFRTKVKPGIKYIDVAGLDFSCRFDADNAKTLDMNLDGQGDVTKQFVPYTFTSNLALVKKGMSDMPQVPAAAAKAIAAYPQSSHCVRD